MTNVVIDRMIQNTHKKPSLRYTIYYLSQNKLLFYDKQQQTNKKQQQQPLTHMERLNNVWIKHICEKKDDHLFI